MSIESLNKAATAAGFAMATPEDDTVAEALESDKTELAESRALVLANTQAYASGSDSLTRVTEWVKSHFPSVGWRAPA